MKHGEILGYVNKKILDHEIAITIGIAEIHQYAGYSGGYKGITIGCGGRQTISALHHRDFVLQEEIIVGKISKTHSVKPSIYWAHPHHVVTL